MAGLIPQAFIDQLLDRIDIVDLIDGFVPLKKAGANYKACCPFHGEKTPSFTVSRDKQFYHCFGCSAHGTAITFLMEHNNLEFRDAVTLLAQQAGLDIPEDSVSSKSNRKPDGIDLYQLMAQVTEHYEQALKSHPQADTAKRYLQSRGLTGAIAKEFQLGFAPDAWDTILQAFGKNQKTKNALQQIGLLSKNEQGRIYDRFRHRIMFPIADYRGRLVGFGGRVMGDGEPKYLNSPETPLFHKGSELYGLFQAKGDIRQHKLAIVVEGYMDVIALAQYDIRIAVAALGTALTPAHLERLFRFTPNIVICFDGDRAGKQAAWRAMENALPLLQDGRQIRFLFLAEGEDPDSTVREIGKDAFLQRVDGAQSLTDFLLQSLQQQSDLSTLEGRAKLANDSKAYVNKLPAGMLRKLLLEQITAITQIDAVVLNQSIGQPDSAQRVPQRARVKQSSHPIPLTKIRRAMALLLQNPHFHRIAGDMQSLKNSGKAGEQLFADLVETLRKHQGLNTASLLERYRQHDHFNPLQKLATIELYEDSAEQEALFVAVTRDLRDELESADSAGYIETLLQKNPADLTEDEKALLKNHRF